MTFHCFRKQFRNHCDFNSLRKNKYLLISKYQGNLEKKPAKFWQNCEIRKINRSQKLIYLDIED